MSVQYESGDISQWAAYALEPDEDDVSSLLRHRSGVYAGHFDAISASQSRHHVRDPSVLPDASTTHHVPASRVITQGKETSPRGPPNLAAGHVAQDGGKLNRQDVHKRKRLRQTSQTGLPSTIPDSVRSRMNQPNTQSPQDTQPASPWVYEKCTTIHAEADTDSYLHEDVDKAIPNEDGEDSPAQSQRIDLLTAFDQSSIPIGQGYNGTESDEEEDPLSQDIRADPFPESKRFQMPKTPASHGVKRKRGSESRSQEAQTPSLPANPFANRQRNHGMMQPSQLFQTTQALTSPLNAQSEGFSDRPSPGLHVQRPSTADALPSPVQLPRSKMVRAVTEPQTVYVSVKESQEARERRLQELEDHGQPEDGSEDEFSTIGSQIRRKLNRDQITKAARDQFAGVTAQSQPHGTESAIHKPYGRGPGEAQSSPLRPGRQGKGPRRPTGSVEQSEDAIMISDDLLPDELEGNITEEETEREEDQSTKGWSDGEGNTEENKENIEVPMTGSRPHQAASQTMFTQPTPSHAPSRGTAHISRAPPISLTSSSPSSRRSPERAEREHISLSSSQAYAVADSQSSQRLKQVTQPSKLSRHQTGPSSSLESRAMIPQSQISQRKDLTASNTSSDPGKASLTLQNDSSEGSSRQKQLEEASTSSRRHQGSSSNTGRDQDTVQHEMRGLHGRSPTSLFSMIESARNNTRAPIETHHPNGGTSTHDIAKKTPANFLPSHFSASVSASKSGTGTEAANPSGPSTVFETALEQQVGTPSKNRIRTLQTTAKGTKSSPAKSQSQPARLIADIMADPSPPEMSIGDELDMSFLDNEDVEFNRAMQGPGPQLPTPRRRKIKAVRTLQVSSQLEPISRSPFKLRGTPKSPSSSAYSWCTAPQSSSQSIESTTTVDARSFRETSANTSPKAQQALPVKESRVEKEAGPAARKSQIRPPPLAKDIPLVALMKHPDDISPHVQSTDHNDDAPGIVAPDRVLAHFNGIRSRFYPATCTGLIPGDEPRYEVTFDDGEKDTISGYGIKRLELRAGDVCKVDLRDSVVANLPGGRSFIVVGTRGHQSSNTAAASTNNSSKQSETDIFGHTHVVVRPKHRQSVDELQEDDQELTVSLGRIYFTQTMWGAIKDRDFSCIQTKLPGLTGLQTPSERPSTPSTPSSRARRIRSSGLAAARPGDISAGANEGLFNNMVFALTNVAFGADLEKVKKVIRNSGGRILDDGFDDLFHIPDLSRTTSPSKNRDKTFHLTSAAESLGFTCLIADGHCRRAKYIQALALGIPCVATRWVTDCVSKQALLPIAPYLLPAGESSFLSGAIRSRVLDPLPDPATATLSDLFSKRPIMLTDTSILLIMQKHEEGAMKHHNFLTHALGATRIARATSVEAAAKSVAEAQLMGKPWDWVYTHGKEKQAEKMIFGGGSARTRKRGAVGEGSKKTRVVGNEYVIQSLILGRLCDE
ncbi:uncharacterized protein KY384_005204 [Bacidia gigantensis]|uniref:uncharacterized protein n=1 Tax=Bacidia gigantensis TaxID=2732470 RepID=UPI001D043C4E|nr:uncharacterized protein KY384_005204 [Bacidia gigantensis]KAG8529723.1 hypothetical protein KY384_005204 [Bacidia gigantensis]